MGKLDEIRQRVEAATPGPWEQSWDRTDHAVVDVNGTEVISPDWYDAPLLMIKQSDAEFVIHAREDIPYLLSEVDRLNALHKREIIVTGEYAQRVIDLTARAEAALASAKQVVASTVASEVHKPGGEQE